MPSFLEHYLKSLEEKLLPSQYRGMVKGWNKERYQSIFTNPKYEHDRNGYRIYIPLVAGKAKITPNKDVAAFVQSKGFEITDYSKGLASKPGSKNAIRIGKLLDDPIIKKAYDADPARQAQDSYEVVISRHPYDIAGMSTDRGWTSCMNLENGIYKRFVPLDVELGSVVAYIIKVGDRNIEKPVGRMLIKPFVNMINPDEVMFGIEDRIYGTDVPGFSKTVNAWVKEVNIAGKFSGVFTLDSRMYQDSKNQKSMIIGVDSETKKHIANIIKSPSSIQNIKNPSEQLQKIAAHQDGTTIQYIDNPSDEVQVLAVKQNSESIRYIDNPSNEVQVLAVKRNGENIRHIKNPSEEAQLLAVQQDGSIIRYIDNPSKEVQQLAVQQDGSTIRYIKKPSEQLQKIAVQQDGMAISHIENPSEQLQHLAVSQNGMAIRYIENPSEQLQKIAVQQDGMAIRNIKNPSEQLQRLAVQQDGMAIRYIENPTEEIQMLAVQNNKSAIRNISNPTKNVQSLAKKDS